MKNQIMPTKFSIDFYIRSGIYTATFYSINNFDCSIYKEYQIYKKIENIMAYLLIAAILAFIIPIIVLFFKFSLIMHYRLIYFVILAIIAINLLIIYSIIDKRLNSLMYDYIIYDLKRAGANITYRNKSTGTISYNINGRKIQLSVYKGYNSHANSRYW